MAGVVTGPIGRSWARAAALVTLALSTTLPGVVYADDIATPTSTSICDMPSMRGTAAYNQYCVGSAQSQAVQTGPSQEELQRQRDQQDIQDASDDAWDHGVSAYKRGDYEEAVKDFKEALSYTPDNPDLQMNLDRSQKKLDAQRAAQQQALLDQQRIQGQQQVPVSQQRSGSGPVISGSSNSFGIQGNAPNPGIDSSPEKRAVNVKKAVDQARTARTSGHEAAESGSTEQGRNESGCAFDKAGCAGLGAPVGNGGVYAGNNTKYDPVVPEGKRTPQITNLEKQRSAERDTLQKLHAELKGLDPRKDAVKIAQDRDAETAAQNKVQFLNFSINSALESPPAAAKPQADRKKTPPR